MINYQAVSSRDEHLLQVLLNLWESSVRHTHLFLSEQNIAALRPLVLQALQEISHLLTCNGDHKQPLGFIGIHEHKIEMLFVSPCAMG